MFTSEGLPYPLDEIEKNKELEHLFEEWMNALNKNSTLTKEQLSNVVFDGFYPYYFHQNVKVLFIGREPCQMGNDNYIEILYDAYKENRVGGTSINARSRKFHNIMFYIAYAFNYGFPEWKDIEYASELTDSFATENGISFAFMNLSKISNESSTWNLDSEQLEQFINPRIYSDINYINKEIELLNPDVVISMNLGEYLNALGKNEKIHSADKVDCYYLHIQKKKVILIDSFHFSAPSKDDILDYYEPIKNAYISLTK